MGPPRFDYKCLWHDCESDAIGLLAINDDSTGLTLCTIPACGSHAEKVQLSGALIVLSPSGIVIGELDGRADIELTFVPMVKVHEMADG